VAQFLFAWCNDPIVGGNALVIAGPKGVETVAQRYLWDTLRGFYVNDLGEAVWSLEFASDRSSFYAVYGGTFGGLPFDVFGGPVFPGYEEIIAPSMTPSVLVTGLSDQGIASGIATYDYESAPTNPTANTFSVDVPVTWDLGIPKPLPEPTSLMLFVPGLLALLGLKLKKVLVASRNQLEASR